MSSNSRFLKFLFVQALTLGRIPLIMIFLAVSLVTDTRSSSLWFCVAFFSMILSALTDVFDGYFARRFNMTSRLGAYADPLTDKVFYLTTFPTLVYLSGLANLTDPGELLHTRLLLALAIIFLARDQWVSFLRSIGALHNLDARANWSGKARTIISFPVICAVYYYLQVPRDWPLQPPRPFIYVLEAVMLVINLISIWVYTAHFWPALRKELRMPEPKS